MEKKYKALALDLDGTLMDSNKKLSDVNKKAVWEAIDVGTAVILGIRQADVWRTSCCTYA